MVSLSYANQTFFQLQAKMPDLLSNIQDNKFYWFMFAGLMVVILIMLLWGNKK